MNAQELLQEISTIAATADLPSRLSDGPPSTTASLHAAAQRGRITTTRSTHPRLHHQQQRDLVGTAAIITRRARGLMSIGSSVRPAPSVPALQPTHSPCTGEENPQRNFRFFRQSAEVSLFVNTCSENGSSPIVSRSSSPTSIRARRRCACSTRAWPTAP